MLEINNNIISSDSREELLTMLRKKANSSCNTCNGMGTEGYKEDKSGSRTYIPCSKCINKTIKIPSGFSFIKNKKKN